MGTTTVKRWADVREAYRSKDLCQALYDGGQAVMSDCLLNLHGRSHRDRRRVENRLFRRETFVHWEHEVLGQTIDATLAPVIAAGVGDLVDIGYRLSMNLTATIAGLDVDPTNAEQTDALHSIVATLSEGATMSHSTRPEHELLAEIDDAIDTLQQRFLGPAMERRRTDPGTDVLSVLLANQQQLELSDDSIRREIGFYLQAGAHSTANALVHTFNDLFAWLQTSGTALATVVDDLELLQRVFYESLRLHPASPVALRRATRPTAVASQAIDEGDLVEMDLYAANTDPEIFGPDAATFNPLRTLPEAIPPWGNSFGGGVHSCIGQELDGGVPVSATTTDQPLFGTITVMLHTLLRQGCVPDPHNDPAGLSGSTRAHFGSYPVVIDHG